MVLVVPLDSERLGLLKNSILRPLFHFKKRFCDSLMSHLVLEM